MKTTIEERKIQAEDVLFWEKNTEAEILLEVKEETKNVVFSNLFGRLEFAVCSNVGGFSYSWNLNYYKKWFEVAEEKNGSINVYHDFQKKVFLEVDGLVIPAAIAAEILDIWYEGNPLSFVEKGFQINKIQKNKAFSTFLFKRREEKLKGEDLQIIVSQISEDQAGLFLYDSEDLHRVKEGNNCSVCGKPLGHWTQGDFEELCPECTEIMTQVIKELTEAGKTFCFFCDKIMSQKEVSKYVPHGNGMRHTEVAHVVMYDNRVEVPELFKKARYQPRPSCRKCNE